MRRRFLKLIPLFLFAYKGVRNTCLVDSNSELDEQQKIMMAATVLDHNNRELITYKCYTKPEESELIPFTVTNVDQEYPVVVTRFQGKIYAIGGVCTYDGETDLSQGICFGNKLYCPKHGCQYDVTNGWVENAPAIDNLPIFGITEKQDCIELYAPRLIPRRIIPQYNFRDFNDLRKVVIYGRGATAYGCLSGLKENAYTGELTLVTEDAWLPYDRTKMTKRIRATKPEDFYFRGKNWYETTGIDVLFGRKITYISSKHNNAFVELDDGFKQGYDALVIATGTTPCHKPINGLDQQKYYYLKNMNEHQEIKERLKITKNLTVIGINTQSLEVVSTIRQEYPDVKIHLVEPNEKSSFETYYGKEIADLVLNLHVEKGVNIYENARIKHFTADSLQFRDNLKIPSDTVLLFPNINVPNTEFAEISEHGFEFDNNGRIKADFNQRTEIKRIFAAGSCSSTFYFTNGTSHQGEQWTAAFHQGQTAAYNVLALNVPWHQIPFSYTEQYGKVLQQTSSWKDFDQIFIEGDLEKWDFIAYYGLNDFIVGAVGTPSKKNRVAVINEAIRCSHMPFFQEMKMRKYTSDDIFKAIRKLNKSGCYKQSLYKFRHDFVPEFNIWTLRDNMSKMYTPWVDTELSYAPPPKGVQE